MLTAAQCCIRYHTQRDNIKDVRLLNWTWSQEKQATLGPIYYIHINVLPSINSLYMYMVIILAGAKLQWLS